MPSSAQPPGAATDPTAPDRTDRDRAEPEPAVATHDPSKRPGPESTLADVRERLVAEAVAALERLGVDIGLDHIKLADVIEAAGVGRSSAYRSLADDDLAPQEVLHRETLAQILQRRHRETNLSIVTERTLAELERQRDNLDADDSDRREHAIRSLIRVGAEASFRQVVSSVERSVLISSYGALRSGSAKDWRHDALVRGEEVLATLFGELYAGLSAIVGYQLRPGLTMEQFSTAIAGLLEGLAMRDGVSPHLDRIERPTGPDGESEPWTLFAIGFEGIYSVFFEPIPEPATD